MHTHVGMNVFAPCQLRKTEGKDIKQLRLRTTNHCLYSHMWENLIGENTV